MDNPNELLSKIEASHLWAYFHKDWLLEMRQRLRPHLPPEYHVFVESEGGRYSLRLELGSARRPIAVLELVTSEDRSIGSRLDREKYLRKRESFLEAGVNFLEIDALLEGERLLPAGLQKLAAYDRNAWTAAHHPGGRRHRGHGWNAGESLPEVLWEVEEGLTVNVDLAATFRAACEFNRWEQMV